MIKTHKGFSLIEIMVVISTIAILAAFALPAYQDYVIRSKVSEGLTLAASAKLAAVETFISQSGSAIAAYSGTGPAPENSYTYTFNSSKHVASIAIAGIANTAAVSLHEGRISITYETDLHTALGVPLLLTPGSGTLISGTPSAPLMVSTPIIWGCTIDSVTAFRYVPANCRFLP